jgi:signal transduction histidine kinase
MAAADTVQRTAVQKEGPRASRLRRRLLGWFLVLSLVPLVVSGTLGYVRSYQIIEDVVERDLKVIIEVQVAHISDRADRYLSYLQAVATGNEFLAAGIRRVRGEVLSGMEEAANRQVLDAYLKRQLGELPYFDALFLEGWSGEVLASSAPLDQEMASQEDPAQRGGRTRIAAIPGSTPSDRPRLRITVPVTGIGGEPVGFYGGIVESSRVSAFFDIPQSLSRQVESFILDREGRPLFVSNPHAELDYTKVLQTPLVAMSPGSHARYGNRDGVEVVGRSMRVPGQPWLYIAEVPVSEALGDLWLLRKTSIYLGLVFVLLVAVAGWFVSRGIVAPVRRLVDAARTLGGGNLAARVELARGDEIGELGQAFNDMADELARTSAQVKELHQREIERAQQLATVGELASGLAHEIKNPVVGISNGLDLVKRRVGDDPDLQPIMNELTRELDRIEGAIRDLLAFARPSDPALARTDGNRIVERAIRLVQPSAEQRDVGIEMHLDSELPEIQADAELVRQALVNLVLNAIQATPARGRIQVSSGSRNGAVEIRVTDTGRGIPKELQELIFKPFFTTRHSGTGLGLSITRTIVERHGGSLEVESEEGCGTSFTMVLPVSPESDHGTQGKERGC